ncbi:MAG: hypothetical protein ACOY40_12855 [Bacillota bacterium]
MPWKWEKAAGGPTENQLREVTGAGAGRGPALYTVALLFVRTFVRDPDFRKSVACFLAAAVLEEIGRSLAAAGEKGVNVVEPVFYQAGRWKRRNPLLLSIKKGTT